MKKKIVSFMGLMIASAVTALFTTYQIKNEVEEQMEETLSKEKQNEEES